MKYWHVSKKTTPNGTELRYKLDKGIIRYKIVTVPLIVRHNYKSFIDKPNARLTTAAFINCGHAP